VVLELRRGSAKHLRSRDRTLNGALYPRIFYPELYILEGGYCGFYQSQPVRTETPRKLKRSGADMGFC
jgi:hypothetical protein